LKRREIGPRRIEPERPEAGDTDRLEGVRRPPCLQLAGKRGERRCRIAGRNPHLFDDRGSARDQRYALGAAELNSGDERFGLIHAIFYASRIGGQGLAARGRFGFCALQ
jgi:hypothetical protein